MRNSRPGFFILLWVLVGSVLAVVTEAAAVAVPAWQEKAQALKLWETPQWRNLLHYKKGLLGWQSQADGARFFLAEKGKTDPEAELLADVRAFLETPVADADQQEQEWFDHQFDPKLQAEKEQPSPLAGHAAERDWSIPPVPHPICQFPARWKWLDAQLGLSSQVPKLPACLRWSRFERQLAVKSASVVFSSYYLNNPSSAFGHTLLKINRYTGEEQASGDLLNYGINYAAMADTGNPLLYAFYGLFGFFRGNFTSIPYFYKVREYSDFETRDLWEYELSLLPPELDLMVRHLWELGSTHFDYYYLTENCSYHILSVLEVARPSLKLTDQLPIYVIPSDTVRLLQDEPGLVKRIGFRPSIRSQFVERLHNLSEAETKGLKTLMAERSLETEDAKATLDAMPADSQRKVLDALLDALDFRYGKEILDENEPHFSQKWKQAVLIRRSQLRQKSTPLQVPTPVQEAPHAGHRSSRWGVFAGAQGGEGAALEFQHRFALHDLLDPVKGFPSYAQIEFMDARARLRVGDGTASRLELERFKLFQVVSLNDYLFWNPKISWRVMVSTDRYRDGRCETPSCLGTAFEVGGGFAKMARWGALDLASFILVDGHFSVGSAFLGSKLRLGAGPALGIRARWQESLALSVQGKWRAYGPGDRGVGNPSGLDSVLTLEEELRWSASERWSVSVKGGHTWFHDYRLAQNQTVSEGQLGVLVYY